MKEEVIKNINAGINLISPECAIPFNVPNINLMELVNTAHRTKSL
ncbi:hypothetical protein QKW49_23080 [Petroclostridium sp. X23]|nr:hypothetical protein [Petroclostridium sp. X23]WHH61775.1 hypothetical protein QKW49_23080 [Petroclostridium sp. X23]